MHEKRGYGGSLLGKRINRNSGSWRLNSPKCILTKNYIICQSLCIEKEVIAKKHIISQMKVL